MRFPRVLAIGVALILAIPLCAEEPAVAEPTGPNAERASEFQPRSVEEARARAQLLHEMIHGALQVVHRDFFDEETIHAIPSRSLEDVFLELERSYGVSIRWIAVNAKALNVDHKPRDEFEHQAVKALTSGKDSLDTFDGEQYRHIGSIRMASQCLKCHLPGRSSNADRLAGLSIAMTVSSTAGSDTPDNP